MARAVQVDYTVQVNTRGAVASDAVDRAIEELRAALRHTAEPVLFARLRLTRLADPAVERPVIGEADVDVNGRMLRVHVAAPTDVEAAEQLGRRLRDRLARMSRSFEARRGGRPEDAAHAWRHGQRPTRRPPFFPRAAEDRQIVRRKTVTPVATTPDEAVFDLEMADRDFQLFTDVETGADCLICRGGAAGHRLTHVGPVGRRRASAAIPVTVARDPAPVLSLDEAVRQLDLADLPFVFFQDESTGRGHVVYHRYDGHYGLVSAA